MSPNPISPSRDNEIKGKNNHWCHRANEVCARCGSIIICGFLCATCPHGMRWHLEERKSANHLVMYRSCLVTIRIFLLFLYTLILSYNGNFYESFSICFGWLESICCYTSGYINTTNISPPYADSEKCTWCSALSWTTGYTLELA